MRTQLRLALAAWAGLALLLTGVGCSGSSDPGKAGGDKKPGEKGEQEKPKTATVSGRVMYRDQPLPAGTVIFAPAEGKPLTGLIDADGSYAVQDVPVGEVRVAVTTESVSPPTKPRKGTPPSKEGPARGFIKIPAKYANPQTSGIMCRVVGGEQTFDIRLID